MSIVDVDDAHVAEDLLLLGRQGLNRRRTLVYRKTTLNIEASLLEEAASGNRFTGRHPTTTWWQLRFRPYRA